MCETCETCEDKNSEEIRKATSGPRSYAKLTKQPSRVGHPAYQEAEGTAPGNNWKNNKFKGSSSLIICPERSGVSVTTASCRPVSEARSQLTRMSPVLSCRTAFSDGNCISTSRTLPLCSQHNLPYFIKFLSLVIKDK